MSFGNRAIRRLEKLMAWGGRRHRLKSGSDTVTQPELRTRRQLVVGAAGTAIGGTALVAEAALRPRSSSAQNTVFVDTATNQTVGGVKTFTSPPVVPAGAFPQDAVAGLVAGLAAKQGALRPGTYVDKSKTQGGTLAAPESDFVWRFQPRDPAKGHFGVEMWGADFFGSWDNVMGIGYNIGEKGAPAVANEPVFRFNIEQDYFENGTTHTLEAYFEWVPKSGLFSDTRRPMFWQFNRDKNTGEAGSLKSFSFCAESIVFLRWSDNAQFLQLSPGSFSMFGVAGLPSSLALNTPAGKGSALYMQHDATNVLRMSTINAAQFRWDVGTASLFGFANRGFSINLYDNSSTFSLQSVDGGRTVAIRAHPSQVGALQEWQDATGVSYTKISKLGFFMTKKTAAPADADLANSEVALWWDATPGAGGVRYRGKDRTGAIVSGSLS